VATTQDIQSWLQANPNANDQQIAQAMQQYGVTPDQMAQATGIDPSQVGNRFNVANARNYIDSNWGGSYGSNGQFQPGSLFSNGSYNYGGAGTLTNAHVLGAMQSLGLTPQQESSVLGIPADQISAWGAANKPLVDSAASVYQTDMGNQPSYMQSSYFSPPGGAPAGASAGGVTSDQINGWLQSHPGATDQQIAAAMQQYGVTPQQMSAATGLGLNNVQARYNAATNADGLGTNGPDRLNALAQRNGYGGMTTQAFGPNGYPIGHGPHNGSMQLAGQGGTGMAMNGGGQGSYLGGGAFGPAGGYGYFGTQGNPYLDGMAANIARQTNLGLTDAFNQIRSNDVSNGTLGGSRQGVAQGVATGRAMDSLQGNLSNLYGGAFDSQMNRGLGQYQTDTNAYLGNQGQQLDFYSNQRAQDQNGAALGAQLYGLGQQGQWSPYQNAGQIYGNFGGYGTQTGQQSQGGGGVGAIGGALGTAQLMNNLNNPYGSYGGLGLGGSYGIKF
jgi:uncharacterized protein YneF (UPF0154 family)